MKTEILPNGYKTTYHMPSFNAVTAAKNLISESGLVIPKGTPGRILSWTPTGQLVIDFEAQPVFVVPSDSTMILIGGKR